MVYRDIERGQCEMARTKQRNKNFIQGAIEKPGTFRAYCKRQGYSKVTSACIKQGLSSRDRITRQRANLARTLMRIRD